MKAPKFEIDIDYARERLHKFANGNKRKVNLLLLRRKNEQHLLFVEILWKRLCEKYYTEPEFEIRFDFACSVFIGACLGIILAVVISMICGVITYPY